MNPTEPPKPAPTKAELEAKHGTPHAFCLKMEKAYQLGQMKLMDAAVAVVEYEREWSAAK